MSTFFDTKVRVRVYGARISMQYQRKCTHVRYIATVVRNFVPKTFTESVPFSVSLRKPQKSADYSTQLSVPVPASEPLLCIHLTVTVVPLKSHFHRCAKVSFGDFGFWCFSRVLLWGHHTYVGVYYLVHVRVRMPYLV